MEKNDAIETLFKRLEGELDTAIPSNNHESLFLKKLQQQQENSAVIPISRATEKPWIKWLSIAASIVFIIGVFSYTISYTSPTQADLASVSPELEKTQEFFTNAITKQLQTLENTTTSDNKALIADALKALEELETNYNKLKEDLVTSGNDKRVISAMILNFQKRITLLENVLKNAQEINDLKVQYDEKQSI